MNDFELYRGLLFSIAYRMTGSAADAEDLVQDAYVRYASTETDVVRDVKAFLVTVLTRLALDKLKSAQSQRETYIGPWLPEPVFTNRDDPFGRITREEQIETALLAALERLNPQERAVLLLHEVLDHDHPEIAEMLGITPAASRQLLHRGRERVAEQKPRFRPSREQQEQLVGNFLAAVRNGDVEGLRRVLTEDVVSRGDGGGKAFAARRPLVGFEEVSRLLLGLLRTAPEGTTVTMEEINGQPGLAAWLDGKLFAAMSFVFDGERIAEVMSVVNPDKLTFAQRQATR